MPIPKTWPWYRRLRAYLTWASAEQAADPSPWAMGWRLLFRPDLWRSCWRKRRDRLT